MKQALKGGEGMEHVPLVALVVNDRGIKETLLPGPREASRRWRLLSSLFLE